jgi:hypothetical protein
LERAAERAQNKSDQFNEALGKVYARPEEARERFDQTVKAEGFERAARRLERHPEAFGALRPTEHKAVFGLVTRTEYDTARGHAGTAAARGYEAGHAGDQMRAHVDDIGRRTGAKPGDYVHTVEQLGDRIRSAEHRLNKLGAMQEALPSRGELIRELRDTVRDFGRADLARFGGLVTERQYAFALKIANGVRDVLLGRDRDAGLGL